MKIEKQRIGKGLFYCGVLSMTCFILSLFYKDATSPRIPDVIHGLIYPIHSHGHIYYVGYGFALLNQNFMLLLIPTFVGGALTGVAKSKLGNCKTSR